MADYSLTKLPYLFVDGIQACDSTGVDQVLSTLPTAEKKMDINERI